MAKHALAFTASTAFDGRGPERPVQKAFGRKTVLNHSAARGHPFLKPRGLPLVRCHFAVARLWRFLYPDHCQFGVELVENGAVAAE